MFGNRNKIKQLKEIDKLEKIASDKKQPAYKRHQAITKLFDLRNKYDPKVFHDSSKGTYIRPKEENKQ